jgi:two-component system, NarL family, sensor histidine kinase UhpB
VKKVLLLLILFEALNTHAQTKVIDSLQRIVALQKNDTIELTALNGITNEYLRLDLQKSKKYAFQTIALAKELDQDRWLSGSYNYLTTIYRETGLQDSSVYYLGLSENLVQKHPANTKMRFNFNQSASLYYKNIGEYKEALPYMLDNLRIWTKPDENRAGQFLNIGNLYLSMGDYKRAADAHINSLRLFESLNVPRGQSFCLHSLGNDFLFLKQPETAKKYFEQSLALKVKLGDKRGSITSTSGLGDAHKDLKEYKKAYAYYTEAMAMAQEIKMLTEVARILNQRGLLLRRMNELEKARENFEQSMELSLQLGDSATFKRTRSEKIGLELLEKSNQNTELELLNGLNTVIRTGDRQQQANEYAHLSDYYAANKDFEKAFYYMQKHEALSDSVEGNSVLLQIKELEERYNSDKKEQQIALLQKDQQLQLLKLKQQQTNITLIVIAMISVVVIATLLVNRYRVMNRIRRQAELETMRQNISRDLHDDIGSTLSSINIMSKLAMQQSNNASHLQKISTYSNRMMETMGDIVWSINPVNDSVDQMVVRMKEFAGEILEPKNIHYEFSYENSIKDIRLNVEKRKSLFLIFKEAINNLAKYSEATQVVIRLQYANEILYMQVRDNGKGFDASANTSGNGLKNMAARAKAIQGKWTQFSEPGKGTSIEVEVPIT